MAKPILPGIIIDCIETLFRKGYTREAVFRFMKDRIRKYIDSETRMMRAISRIESRTEGIPKRRIKYPQTPEVKEFDLRPYTDMLNEVSEITPGRKISETGIEVAMDILQNYEGFEKILRGPDFAGTPFDLLGFRGKKPYIVGLRCSLLNLHYPDENRKRRMEELLGLISGLCGAFLQLALKEGRYRLFRDNQMDLLFFGPRMYLEIVENWIRSQV